MAQQQQARKPRTSVAMTHPTGRFTVNVSEARARTLAERGYRPASTGAAAAAAPEAAPEAVSTSKVPKRPELVARAKAAGVAVKGTNAELLAAVEEAERTSAPEA